MIAQGPGRWADPARTATDVAAAVRLVRAPATPVTGGWLASWLTADAAARAAGAAILDADDAPSEPRLARDLAAGLPDGVLLWAASSLPIRDLDQQMAPRAGVTVLASRGASGIDGLISSASGAALAHQRAGGGPAVALLGDLAFLHDAPGLFAGPEEPRPDLLLVVVNNDGGGIFSLLEQAAFPAPFERVFGTPHGGVLGQVAAAAGIPAVTLERASGLAGALKGEGLPATGIRMVEVRTSRAAGTALRAPAAGGLHGRGWPGRPGRRGLIARLGPAGAGRCPADQDGPAPRDGRQASSANCMGRNLAWVSASSASGSEPLTMPPPANSRARGPSISAHRSAMPHSPLPRASTHPTGPA